MTPEQFDFYVCCRVRGAETLPQSCMACMTFLAWYLKQLLTCNLTCPYFCLSRQHTYLSQHVRLVTQVDADELGPVSHIGAERSSLNVHVPVAYYVGAKQFAPF